MKKGLLVGAIIALLVVVGGAVYFLWFPTVRDEEPPTIIDLTWEPTRVLNSKVYDGTVSFTAEDEDSIISEASLQFVPKDYPDLPQAAFPEESERQFDMTPVDGGFDENSEDFLFSITDIIGGREYDITVNVRDKAGNFATASLTTPYIREFENIAPLDDVMIGAYYYPWYGPRGGPYDGQWGLGYTGTILLGEYRSSDSLVISKHIDWATGHGIDFFYIEWHGPETEGGNPGAFLDTNIKHYFLENPLIDDIRFAITYPSQVRLITTYNEYGNVVGIDVSDTDNLQKILGDFNYLELTYFSHPQYLRIGDGVDGDISGSPLVFLYLSRLYIGDVEETIQELRGTIGEVYLYADEVYWGLSPRDPSVRKRIKLYDGVTAYSLYASDPQILYDDFLQKADDLYEEWFLATNELNIDFRVNVFPGFDDTSLMREYPTQHLVIERSEEGFQAFCIMAREYWGDTEFCRGTDVTSFNEWGEGTFIEPSRDYGFKYLDIVRNYLC